MHVFLSYSRKQKKLAGAVEAALSAAGHRTFLDEKTLPPGEEYNARIRRALQDSDVLVFLASPDAVRSDSYAMTELGWAREKWPNPAGRVLPVVLGGLDPSELPDWVGAVSAMRADEGNLEARIVAWVDDRAESGSAVPGVLSPREKLERWSRLAQPPLRKGRRVLPARALAGVVGGFAFVGFGVFAGAFVGDNPLAGSLDVALFTLVPMTVGAVLVLVSIARIFGGLRGGEGPMPVLVLDRSTSNNTISLQLQTLDRGRIKVEPVGMRMRKIYPGDMGWAWIRSGLLLDFSPASPDE